MKIKVTLLLLAIPILSIAQSFTKLSTGTIVTESNSTTFSAIGDLNNDGWLDIYFSNDATPNTLFINNGNLTFTKITTGPQVNDANNTRTSLLFDYDNDGDLDIYCNNGRGGTTTISQANTLFRNDGNLNFVQVFTSGATSDSEPSIGGTFADYDNDGDIDIFYVNAETSIDNRLFSNNGNGTFTDQSTSSSFHLDHGISSSSVSFDYDNDGFMDLLVGNRVGVELFLYKNNNGTFNRVTNVGTSTMLTETIETQGITLLDFNNDGAMDVFLCNSDDTNNGLFKNNGDGTFTRITTGAIVNDQGRNTAAVAADFNNDGYKDIAVGGAGGSSSTRVNLLYMNNGNETFTKINSGSFVTDLDRSAIVGGDLNNDGFIDIVSADLDNANEVYINTGNSNSWMKIKLQGSISNYYGVGSTIEVYSNSNGIATFYQYDQVTNHTNRGFSTVSETAFGFGAATVADSLIITWPSGTVCKYSNLPLNNIYTFNEAGCTSDISIAEYKPIKATFNIYPNPSNSVVTIELENESLKDYTLSVVNTLGQTIKLESFNNGLTSYKLDMNNTPKGIYFISLEKDGYIITEKLIVE